MVILDYEERILRQSVIADRLIELREKSGLQQSDVSKGTGIDQSMVSRHESGSRIPGRDMLERYADFFKVSVDYLLGRADSGVNECTPIYEVRGQYRNIPIISDVRAGPPLLAIQEDGDYIQVPVDEVSGGDYVFFRVKGDSMVGEGIYPRSVVLVRQTPVVESGRIAVVIIDREEATLKRVRFEGDTVTLQAANPAYPDTRYPSSMITVVGEVVELRRSFRH